MRIRYVSNSGDIVVLEVARCRSYGKPMHGHIEFISLDGKTRVSIDDGISRDTATELRNKLFDKGKLDLWNYVVNENPI